MISGEIILGIPKFTEISAEKATPCKENMQISQAEFGYQPFEIFLRKIILIKIAQDTEFLFFIWYVEYSGISFSFFLSFLYIN
jgi:hypothetical protein